MHVDMALEIEKVVKFLDEEIKSEESVKKWLTKLKKIRPAGPGGIKLEMYKVFFENGSLLNTLVQIFKHIIQSTEIPEGWKESVMVMIPKTSKPKVIEFTPVALSNRL